MADKIVRVTRQDVRDSLKHQYCGSAGNCAGATALNRALKKKSYVTYDDCSIRHSQYNCKIYKIITKVPQKFDELTAEYRNFGGPKPSADKVYKGMKEVGALEIKILNYE